MPTQLDQRVPVYIVQRVKRVNDREKRIRLVGHRFAGVLLRPVPLSDMERLWGIDGRGCKLVTDWSTNLDAQSVQAGDLVEINDRSYPIVGVQTRPGYFLEIFIEED